MSDTPDRANTNPSGPAPTFHDKTYRSVGGIFGGGLLLAVMLWLCIDAMVKGAGTAPALAASVLVLGVPLIVAFTLRPVVRSGADRLLVRNPFRTIEAPWGAIESVTATLSVELKAGGRKFVIWALPVSLRQRKRAGRRAMIATGDRGQLASSRGGGGRFGAAMQPSPSGPTQASADKAALELNEKADTARGKLVADAAVPEVKVTWTWWLIAPIAAGALALIILLATG
ncbi:hypothetical protein ABIA32_001320 [Streptacidiphilus sp. MAP12-20]|uniref:PH domain-containing protein n=1 Tax=Streptacidiphilus sp. MAP12-20 TaxID=3156299 RepID=UPI003517A386